MVGVKRKIFGGIGYDMIFRRWRHHACSTRFEVEDVGTDRGRTLASPGQNPCFAFPWL